MQEIEEAKVEAMLAFKVLKLYAMYKTLGIRKRLNLYLLLFLMPKLFLT
jgi:hypothetical protein